MPKLTRKIISINEDRCNGCGICMPACPEQAFQLVNTPNGPKARLVGDFYCDGLGACLGSCPTDALKIIEREADAYDDDATVDRIKQVAPHMLDTHIKHIREHASSVKHGAGCPSGREMSWKSVQAQASSAPSTQSMLRQWPVQLHLISPQAPYFRNADIAVIADCVPFAYPYCHRDFIRDRSIAIACPKLDDTGPYAAKLEQLINTAGPKSLTVVHMEVPCCAGLDHIVRTALVNTGKDIPLKTIIIGIKGEIKKI